MNDISDGVLDTYYTSLGSILFSGLWQHPQMTHTAQGCNMFLQKSLHLSLVKIWIETSSLIIKKERKKSFLPMPK